MLSHLIQPAAAILLAFAFPTQAAFDPASNQNVAVYWGQNSYGQSTGPLAQQNLAYYCSNANIDVIPMAFLTTIADPAINFANSGNACTLFPGTDLLNCPHIGADIATCQTTYGKTILLSIGGATYTEGGFATAAAAVAAANNIWAIFGPQQAGSSALRPFGPASVDGFDFDFESSVQNIAPFANQLRSLMDANTSKGGKNFYLSAAPQCPYPDSADNQFLGGETYMDMILVQYYNNYCGIQNYFQGAAAQTAFNFNQWDNWAKSTSLNKNVKVLLGIPANTGAAGSGYLTGTSLANVISFSKTFSSFGGVMMWDASQAYANSGFLGSIKTDLGAAAAPGQPTPPSKPSPPSDPSPPSGGGCNLDGANQWNQCGGEGWNGATTCKCPYTCVAGSVWYSQCE